MKFESSSSPLLFGERLQERERPKRTVNIFLAGYPPTEWLILWLYGFNFMKLSIRFAVPLFMFVSLFTQLEGEGNVCGYTCRWFSQTRESIVPRLDSFLSKHLCTLMWITCHEKSWSYNSIDSNLALIIILVIYLRFDDTIEGSLNECLI